MAPPSPPQAVRPGAAPPPAAPARAAPLDRAALSHEMRTPMNAILGFAQILAMGDLAPGQRRQVEAILAAGEDLMAIIARRLDAPEEGGGRG